MLDFLNYAQLIHVLLSVSVLQLAAINQHWDDLQGRLDEREQLLGSAIVTSVDFHDNIYALHDWINAVESRLDGGVVDEDAAHQLEMIRV